MRFHIVSHHVPVADGTAAGRILLATCEGLLEEGHDVRVSSWAPSHDAGDLPPWCTWTPLDARSPRWRSLVSPRQEAASLDVSVDESEIAVADDWLSFSAIARHGGTRVLTAHALPRLDARAVRRWSLSVVQDGRAVRHACDRADVVLAYSARVAASLPRRGATVVPAAVAVPPSGVVPVDRPIAAIVADWRWPPNVWARRRLLDAWPDVRARVPGARLLLAGRGIDRSGPTDGVEVLGSVEHSGDVLAQAAVLAFPAPDTSGPKVKVLEALAAGVPVVTTPPGVEGVVDPAGAIVADVGRFGDALADALADPARRAALGVAGRTAIERHHAPVPAARARVAALGTTA